MKIIKSFRIEEELLNLAAKWIPKKDLPQIVKEAIEKEVKKRIKRSGTCPECGKET